ncbi:sigma-54-dependent transcriptional regulator [Saccharicrinis sp. 156]|uniref:sigma-54-dependent transcriptional regulator n=1 Tax=Saccharicrinis sp. 156 TaxID=3417574 RepID=UPI003D34EA87
MRSVLYIDDEKANLDVFRVCFGDDLTIYTATSTKEGYEVLLSRDVQVVLVDQRMPGETGIDFILRVKDEFPHTVFMVVSGYADFDVVKQAIETGRVYRYLSKPWNEEKLRLDILNAIDKYNDEHRNRQLLHELEKRNKELELLQQRLKDEVVYLRKELKVKHGISNIVTCDYRFQLLLSKVKTIGLTKAPVLITGETGTGKELVARAIHEKSNRPGAFVSINCAAIPENLIESELFGHEKGAFTGAVNLRKGKFEIADNGTLFLDEIGEMPMAIQPKLLRVLQEGTVERVGGNKTMKLNVRIVAATNRVLSDEIANGNFRSDLYYRINVIELAIPPLRERKKDIPLLVSFFLKKYNRIYGKKVKSISASSLDCLQRYEWPGNARELENVVERGVIISSSETLSVDLLGDHHAAEEKDKHPYRHEEGKSLYLHEVEKRHIEHVLERTSWKIGGDAGAAELLGLKRTTLLAKMKKLNIEKV